MNGGTGLVEIGIVHDPVRARLPTISARPITPQLITGSRRRPFWRGMIHPQLLCCMDASAVGAKVR